MAVTGPDTVSSAGGTETMDPDDMSPSALFWKEFLEKLPVVADETKTSPSAVLQEYHDFVEQQLGGRRKFEAPVTAGRVKKGSRTDMTSTSSLSLYSVAWAAHSLLTSDDVGVIASSAGTKGSKKDDSSSILWRLKLACLLSLEACCKQCMGDRSKNNKKADVDASSMIATSPFFPLLVQDALATASQYQQQLHSLQVQRDSARLVDWKFRASCFFQFIEDSNLVLAIVGPEKYPQIQRYIDSADANSSADSILEVLEESVQHWTSLYRDDSYVAPVILARGDSELTDAQRLIESTLALQMTDDDGISAEDGSNLPLMQQPDILLQPLPSVDAPFARPLPPPMLPLLGYDADEDEALTEKEQAEVLEYLHAEFIWLTTTNLRLMLIPDDESEDKEATERRRLVLDLLKNQAFQKPLAPNDQHTVMQLLSGNKGGASGGPGSGPSGSALAAASSKQQAKGSNRANNNIKLVQECGLTPQNLPQLVEHNPLVAHECLLQILLFSTSENEKNEYLSSLVGMDMSLHSMEVVNRLATYNIGTATSKSTPSASSDVEPILHPEYILLFIASCIASCRNVQDPQARNRLVRLVCVFIQSLLRNNIVQKDDIYFEVQQFCVEFSRVREASALYKSLKDV